MENKLKVYLAGGWFNSEQEKILDEIEKLLTKYDNLLVYSPRKQTQFKSGSKPTRKTCEIVFNNNIVAIEDCDIMIASTEGKDMGTVFEIGVAYQLGKPIIAIYFHNEPFNLMLEEAAIGGVVINKEQLDYILAFIKIRGLNEYLSGYANSFRYQGLIE